MMDLFVNDNYKLLKLMYDNQTVILNKRGITLEQLKSADKDNLAKTFKEYIGGFSPNVKTLLKNFKFNDEIDKMKKCRVLSTVINQFWNNRAMFDPKETDDTAMDLFLKDIETTMLDQRMIKKSYLS